MSMFEAVAIAPDHPFFKTHFQHAPEDACCCQDPDSVNPVDGPSIQVLRTNGNSKLFLLESPSLTCPLIMKSQDLESHLREAFALSHITAHSNIVAFQGSQIVNTSNLVYLEYLPLPSKNLRQYIGRQALCCSETFSIFSQLVASVVHIHSCAISHHDIKPTNIMYDSTTSTLKLIDFGYSVEICSEKIDFNLGTPLYAAPEVLLGEPHDPRGADVWGLGMVLYEMLTGKNPWQKAKNLEELVDLVMTKSIYYPSTLHSRWIELIERLLTLYPEDRITLPELEQALSALESHI